MSKAEELLSRWDDLNAEIEELPVSLKFWIMPYTQGVTVMTK